MFDHWLIQRCLVCAILEPTPSATMRLQAEDILTDGSELPLTIGLQCGKMSRCIIRLSMQALSAHCMESRFAYVNEEPHILNGNRPEPKI